MGIGLGVFKIVRPRLGDWRGLFPSGEHGQDLRMMEEALAGIYRGHNEQDFETFRSYFSHRRQDTDPLEDLEESAIPFSGTGDYEEYSSPEALQARYGARTAAVKHDDAAPKPVRLTADNDGTDPGAEAVEEEEDLLADVLGDDPLLEPAESDDGLDGDLRSLFEEVEEVHAVPEAVRRAIPEVSINALIAEARDIYSLIGGSSAEAAA